MQFKNPEAEAAWKADDAEPSITFVSPSTAQFIKRWANIMEKHLARGELLEDFAKAASYEADTEGLYCVQYRAAVKDMSNWWKHGELFRVWHTTSKRTG